MEEAISLVPISNPKALLFKAQMLLFLNRNKEACEVVNIAAQQLGIGIGVGSGSWSGVSGSASVSGMSGGGRVSGESGSEGASGRESESGKESGSGGEGESKSGSGSGSGSIDIIKKYQKFTEFERNMYPYVVNNWVLCYVIEKDGNIDNLFAQNAVDLLLTALDLNNKNNLLISTSHSKVLYNYFFPFIFSSFIKNDKNDNNNIQNNKNKKKSNNDNKNKNKDDFVTVGLLAHIDTLRKFLNGNRGNYGASFLW